jgi:hypothetical protein
VALRVFEFVVNIWIHEIRIGIARLATFEHNDRETGVGKLLCQDAPGPAETDDDDVSSLELR